MEACLLYGFQHAIVKLLFIPSLHFCVFKMAREIKIGARKNIWPSKFISEEI